MPASGSAEALVAVAVLRVVFGASLVLVVPGFAVTAALFPPGSLAKTVRLTLGVAVSMIVALIGGFLLNFTPWGMRQESWVALLVIVSAAAAALAGPRWAAAWDGLLRWHGPRLRAGAASPMNWVLLWWAVCVSSVAVAVAISGASVSSTAGYTQLWAVPSDSAAVGQPESVRVGVRNAETATQQYRLDLQQDGEVLQEWPAVTLQQDEQWETTLSVSPPMTSSSSGTPTEIVLYRADAPDVVYRRVTLWW
jgi:uncharacterized membrane protein